jgi:hypothetical protein
MTTAPVAESPSSRPSKAGDGPIIRREPILVVLVALVVACTVVAALVGASPWAAACGSGVVLVMWLVDKLAARSGSEGTFAHGLAVGLAGMGLRIGLALGVLVVIGVFARPVFVDATLAFVATYTVYNFARLWRHPAVPAKS